MKIGRKKSNYKNNWLLECSNITRSAAEKEMHIKWCLQHGADVNLVNKNGRTILHDATRRAETQLVQILIKFNADVNKRDHNGETALHLAIRFGENTTYILKDISSENTNYREDDIPRRNAANKDTKIVNILLSAGADTNIADKGGDTPLHIAVRCEEQAVILQLLKHNANVNIKNNTGDTPLHLAAHRGEAPIFEALLSYGSDVNTTNDIGNTPLHLAAHRGESIILNILLDVRASIHVTNIDGDTPLHLAVRSGKIDSVKVLLNCGSDVNLKNKTGLSALHIAAEGEYSMVALLLVSGANVNDTDDTGNTPLHQGIIKGQEAVVTALFDFGVDVNMKNTAGDTPLHLAVQYGTPSIVELLLRRHADPNIISVSGESPLHVAALFGKSSIIELLLKFKADVNIINSVGNTPLHLAARNLHAHVVFLLLENHADCTIRNADLNTPLSLARIFHFEGNEEVVNLLQNSENLLSSSSSYLNSQSDQLATLNNEVLTDIELNKLNNNTASKFSKNIDTSGLCGQLYESKLLSLVLIRVLNDEEIESFLLGTNNNSIGDMDDICLRYQVNNQDRPVVLFVQGKHREDRKKSKITFEDLWSASGDYSLQKYFESYLTIKEQFQVGSGDPMFEGDFDNVECYLIIYTPAKEDLAKKKTEHKVTEKVHYLINTNEQTESFQYDYSEDDIEGLKRAIVLDRFEKLGSIFLEIILSEKDKTDTLFTNELISKYHVVIGRQVLQPCKTQENNKSYRMWEFRPQFFQSDYDHLKALMKSFTKEFTTKRCDQSNITNEDRDDFKLVIQNPCATNISKLIGKLATYDDETKKLQLIDVAAFRKKMKTDDFKMLQEQFNDIHISDDVIYEAIKMKLEKMKIKLPLSFGNLDMTFRGNEVKVKKRMKAVAEKLNYLFELNRHTQIIDIDNKIIGPGKTIEQGIIDINGGIGSAVGNLLVFDPYTKMLKFNMQTETLPQNAALFLKELESSNYFEKLSSYRFRIYIERFPIDSLDGNEYNIHAKNFLHKLWFYTDQANQLTVEQIVKADINKYYNNDKNSTQINFKIHCDAIFRRAHNDIQKWWKKSNEAVYLNKNRDFFQNAKLDCLNDLLLTVMNHVYESKLCSIDFKFKPQVQYRDDSCVQVPAILDMIFGQQFKMIDKQNRWFNIESKKLKDLLEYAEKLTNGYVAIGNDITKNDDMLNYNDKDGNIVTNILQNNVELGSDTDKIKYTKRSGTSGISGQLYETKLLCLILIRARNDKQIENFLLGTNIRDIGNLDDICLRFRVKDQKKPIALFLQAKHKEKENFKYEDLSIRKVFQSYLKIKNRFETVNEESMFEGDFDNVECNFIVFTPASDNCIRTKKDNKINEKVHSLVNTNSETDSFQFVHTKNDLDSLSKIIILERLKKLGESLLEFMLIEKQKVNEILLNDLIAQYHVVIGRDILIPCNTDIINKKYRMWKFRPEFFEKHCEYLDILMKFFVKKLSTTYWDTSDITNEDVENFKMILLDESAATISKLIGKLLIYNQKSKKMQLFKEFKNDLVSHELITKITERLNDIEVKEDVIHESIKKVLEKNKFELPISFGNLDMTFHETEINLNINITKVAEYVIQLLKSNKATKIINVNDILDIKEANFKSAFGNLLIFDSNTKMLKFDLCNENLPEKATLLLKELLNDKYKPFNEELNMYRVKYTEEFPRESFQSNENDVMQVVEFYNRLWFYPNQAKEDVVENILKEEINKYYCNIGQNVSAQFNDLPELIYLRSHDDIQKWSIITKESPYLTRASELFEEAKDSEIANLFETIINFMYISKTYSVEIKFKQSVSKYFKFRKMHQIFTRMSVTLFKLFDGSFNDAVNIELPTIEEPLPYKNYSSLGDLVFSLEIHHGMEWVVMKMWTVSSYTEYSLLVKAGPALAGRRARDGFLLQQVCNGQSDHIIEKHNNFDDIQSITTRFD